MGDELKQILVLAGAGLSAGAGVPTFRSDDGAWQIGDGLQNALQINEYMGKPKARKIVWDWLRSVALADVKPSAAHMALKKLDSGGALAGVLTQNIDSLELKAGIDPAKVWQIHGSVDEAVCTRCWRRQPLADVLSELYDGGEWSWDSGKTVAEVDSHALHCHEWSAKKNKPCGGVLKPGIVFYGESVRSEAWSNARSALFHVDELWCVGTSLEVWPAADLPRMAVSLGKTVKVVSTGSVGLDGVRSSAWEKITGTADEAVPRLVEAALAG